MEDNDDDEQLGGGTMSWEKMSGSRTTSTDLSLSMCQSQLDFPSLNKIYQHTTVTPVLTKTGIVIPNKPRQWVQTFCETLQSTFQVAGLSIHKPLEAVTSYVELRRM